MPFQPKKGVSTVIAEGDDPECCVQCWHSDCACGCAVCEMQMRRVDLKPCPCAFCARAAAEAAAIRLVFAGEAEIVATCDVALLDVDPVARLRDRVEE